MKHWQRDRNHPNKETCTQNEEEHHLVYGSLGGGGLGHIVEGQFVGRWNNSLTNAGRWLDAAILGSAAHCFCTRLSNTQSRIPEFSKE